MKQNNKVLYTGFKKANRKDVSCTSILLEKVREREKFLFTNDFNIISEEIRDIIKNDYELVIMLGQKPLLKKLSIEIQATIDDNVLSTNFDLEYLQKLLSDYNIDYKISNRPGNSYCNYAYYWLLDAVNKRHLKTKVVFIHIPYIDNFIQINNVINLLNNEF